MGDLVKNLKASKTGHVDADIWMFQAADRIEELESKLAEVTAERDKRDAELQEQHKVRKAWAARAEAAEAALKTARREAFDEAANIKPDVEVRTDNWRHAALDMETSYRNAIRALIEEETKP